MLPIDAEAKRATHEQHYSPVKLANRWDISGNTILRLFRDVPGVLVIDRPETMHKRAYKSMRIPASVTERVHLHLSHRKSSR